MTAFFFSVASLCIADGMFTRLYVKSTKPVHRPQLRRFQECVWLISSVFALVLGVETFVGTAEWKFQLQLLIAQKV